MKNVCIVLIALALYSSFGMISAEDIIMDKGYLYVNGTFIESEDTIQITNQEILFPLRTIFEALGATVIWQKETGNILIKYNEESFICYIREPNPGYTKYFYVKKESTNEYIYLTNMSAGGAYCILNDRTYLYQETGKRLFEALECHVEIETDTHTVKIFN